MLNFFPNKVFVAHQGQGGSGRGLSPRLWCHVHNSAMPSNGLNNCFALADDFLSYGVIDVDNEVGISASLAGVYGSYENTGGDILQRTDTDGGVIRLKVDDDDNDETHIQSGGNVGTMFRIREDSPLTIFEMRYALVEITTVSSFAGLCGTDQAVTDNLVDSTGEIADNHFLGFHTLAATPARLDFVYRRNGEDKQLAIQDVHTMVAGEFVKVGFVWNPRRPSWQRLEVYVNNVSVGTVSGDAVEADTFPNVRLAWNCGAKTHAAANRHVDVDWWAAYQEAV